MTKAGKIFKIIAEILLSLLSILLFALIIGVLGKTEGFMTQLSTLLFPTLAPFAIVLSIIFGVLLAIFVTREEKGALKYIACFELLPVRRTMK